MCRTSQDTVYVSERKSKKKTGSMGNERERERRKRKVNSVEEIEDETKNGYQKKRKQTKEKATEKGLFF